MFCSFFVFSLQEGMSENTKLWSRQELCKKAEALLSIAIQTVISPVPTSIPFFILCHYYCLHNFGLFHKCTPWNPIPPNSSLGSLGLMQLSFLVFPLFLLEQLNLPSLLYPWHFYTFLISSFIVLWLLNMPIPSLVPWPNISCPHLHAGSPLSFWFLTRSSPLHQKYSVVGVQ